MSCEVEQIADCGDISSLGRALFIPYKEDANWLSRCEVSFSSCGSLLAVGFKNRLCILSTQWITALEMNTFIISWSGTVTADISTILVVPICPTNHSSQSGPDWFCVMVGFTNGTIGFYTNTGHHLLSEKYDDKPVMKISCHTGTFGTLPDDINIHYETSECILSGASLFQTLRYAKAQMAKVQAGMQNESTIDGRSISVRKWTFSDQELLSDAMVAGLELKNTYDHLLAASTYGGYDTWYRSIPPHNTLILGAGTKPYLGFHYALEGGTAPPLQDVARAVANKIKSALPGWLVGGGSTEATTKSEPHTRSEALSMRSGLYDIQRHGVKVILSPDRRLAAITDNLGRVVVLDVSRGHVFRLFKGYRDAQCAFVQVFEADNKKPQLSVIKNIRRALFLVIYNPKKGLIDIRLMNRGNRVAVFTATKNGKLIYNTSGLLGAEQSYASRKLNLPQYQCVLMDPDGKIKTFDIPFFFALEGEHSERSKDLHILRDLRDYIKRANNRDDDFCVEILNRASELNTIDLKKHCLEMLIRNYEISPPTIIACLEMFWDSINESELDPQDVLCKTYFINLTLATLFYRCINGECVDDMDNLITKVLPCQEHETDDTENVAKTDVQIPENLNLLKSDSNILERLLKLAQEKDYKEHQHARVTFVDEISSNYKLFVYSFDLEIDSSNEYLRLKDDMSDTRINDLAAELFRSLFQLEDYTKICDYVVKCKIESKDIIKLLIIHLMNKSLDEININMIQRLIGILYCLCSVSDEAKNIVYNDTSEWWEAIRAMLVDTPCPLRSMIVAMTCRVVVQLFEGQYSSAEDEAWESVTTENAKWSILIGKLEDISILSIILYFKETFKGKTLPKLPATTFEINLKFIYSKGKGAVSELISKWLCTMGVAPEAIVASDLFEKQKSNPDQSNSDNDDSYESIYIENHKDDLEQNARIFEWFSLLRHQFPYSTSADNIIANMAWEYAVAWQKDVHNLDFLDAIIHCIKNINDNHLGLGLYIMIWMTYIKDTFEIVCRLVSKVGKMPKERLCLQDVGLTERKMLQFLDLIVQYLEQLMSRVESSSNTQKKRWLYEKIWDDSLPCLVEVAQNTCSVNVNVLNLNYQISLSINFQCKFNLKCNKHLHSLYDLDLLYVFGSLTESNETLDKNSYKGLDNKLRPMRMKFLHKVTMGALDLVTCEENPDSFNLYKFHMGDATYWIEKSYLLAELWNIGSDFLRREQVVGLYRLGYDALIENVLKLVSDPGPLLAPLIAIASQRLKRHLEQSERPAEWVVAVPPEMMHHLNKIESDLSVATFASITSTSSVIEKVLYHIENADKPASNNPPIRLAEVILRTCEIIEQEKL